MRLKTLARPLLGVLLLATLLLAIAAGGVVDVSADVPQGGWIDEAARFVAQRSIAVRAAPFPGPVPQDEAALAEGLRHFDEHHHGPAAASQVTAAGDREH